MEFLKTAGVFHYFAFVCEGCGGAYELGVDSEFIGGRVECPEGCGASYICWDHPETGVPNLFCVVKPVFFDAGETPAL